MSKSLAEILGWEEGAIYRYKNKFFKIKHGLLVSSPTGKQNNWCVDWTVKVNDVFYLKEATKIEPKKSSLKHKFLGSEDFNYLNLCDSGVYTINDYSCNGNFKTKFTNEDIEKIEASGFDLCNFEKVEVEDE
mgnify:CR=1 FL=1